MNAPRAIVVAVVSILATLGGGWEASACTCTPLTPAAALRAADVAFTGSVTAVVDGPAATDPRTVTFDVDAVYKGAVREIAHVQTPARSADCHLDVVAAERYTVFAQRDGTTLTSALCDATTTNVDLLDGVATPEPPAALDEVPARARGRRTPVGSVLLVVAGAIAITALRRRSRRPAR